MLNYYIENKQIYYQIVTIILLLLLIFPVGALAQAPQNIGGPACALITGFYTNQQNISALTAIAVVFVTAQSLFGQMQIGTAIKIIIILALVAGLGLFSEDLFGGRCTSGAIAFS